MGTYIILNGLIPIILHRFVSFFLHGLLGRVFGDIVRIDRVGICVKGFGRGGFIGFVKLA